MKAKIVTSFELAQVEPDSNWFYGVCIYHNHEYKFEAKIFEDPSVFGIKSGCTSKLRVHNEANELVFEYDRGFGVNEAGTEMLNATIGFKIAAIIESLV